MDTVHRDEVEIAENFEKYYFSRKREADRKLKESGEGGEHLLVFCEDKNHNQQRNSGTHYRGFKNKRSQTSPKKDEEEDWLVD